MILFDEVYIAYYRLSTYFRENIPGSLLYYQRIDSILILSILTTFNISSIVMMFHMHTIPGNHSIDFFTCLALIAGILTIRFEYKSRYRKILERNRKNTFLLAGLGYAIISVGTFIYFHSQT